MKNQVMASESKLQSFDDGKDLDGGTPDRDSYH